jgi:hypothetical protein
VLVEALGHVFGQAELAGGSGGRNDTIDERKLQPPGQRAAHLVAVRTIRRRQRHNPSHKPISAHEESIGDAESGGPPGCSVTAGRHDSPEQPPASRCTAIVIKSGGLSFRLPFPERLRGHLARRRRIPAAPGQDVSATGERKWEITCACSWQANRMLAVSYCPR